MSEKLLYYVAFNGSLHVMEERSGSLGTVGEFFPARTLEHLTGCRRRPEVVFAAVAFDGGYRTEDGGRTWEKVLDGDVRTFTVDPRDERVVYAGSGPVRLYRSEDYGASWEPLDGLLEQPDRVKSQWGVPERLRGVEHPHVRHVFVHPDDTDLLFVVLEHGGVLSSRDRGATWQDKSAGIAYLDMHQLSHYPGSKERFYVSSARGFFRSDDCGGHWRRSEDGMPWAYTELHSYSHEWRFMPGDTTRVVLAGAKGSPGVWAMEMRDPEGVILLSDDGGESWRQAAIEGVEDKAPWMPWVLVSHPADESTLFAGMGDGSRGFGFNARERGKGAFYVSRDRGASWRPMVRDMPSVLTAWVAAQ